MSSEALGSRRLHPAGALLGALKAARGLAGPSIFPAAAALFSTGLSGLTLALILLALTLLLVGGAVWGVLWWRTALYGVSDGAFYFKSGVLQKSERSLPLDRIQSVSSVQGVVQRLFGVLEVRVETAGGGGDPEVSLPALSQPAVEELRGVLTTSSAEVETEENAPQTLRRLGVGELFAAGLTSGRIGVTLPIIGGIYGAGGDLIPEDFAEETARSLLPNAIYGALLLAVAIVLAAWILAIAGTVLAHAGFTLSRSADGKYLYIRRGLLERREVTVPLSRIQAVRLAEGVLRQPFGFCELKVDSAGYADEEGVSTTLFPFLPRRDAGRLLSEAAPGFSAPLDEVERPPLRSRRRYVVRACIPALLVTALISVVLFPYGIFALALLVPAALYGLLSYYDAGWGMEGELLMLRSRGLGRTTAVVPARRVQYRSLSVSPLQRRKKLATLSVRVASGSGGTGFSVADLDGPGSESLLPRLAPETRG